MIPVNAFCSNNGKCTVYASTNYPPLTYNWANGDTTYYTENLGKGDISVSVYDALGNSCDAGGSQYIGYVGPSANTSLTYSSCEDSNGTATISATDNSPGGPHTFSYNWSNGQSSSNAIGLAAGFYSFTVTNDSTGCTYIDSIEIQDSCGLFSGRIYIDSNMNGIYDTNDFAIKGASVLLTGNGITSQYRSNKLGNYSIVLPSISSYDIELVAPTFFTTCVLFKQYEVDFPLTGSFSYTPTAGNNISMNNDFRLKYHKDSCNYVSGHVWFDQDKDQIKDALETGYSNKLIQATTRFGFTDTYGNYEIPILPNSSDVLAPYLKFNQITTFPSGKYYTLNLGNPIIDTSGFDFGIGLDTVCDGDAGIYTLYTYNGTDAGLQFNAWTDFKYIGCDTFGNYDSCELTIYHDTLARFLTAVQSPDIIENDRISWIYPPNEAPQAYCMFMTWELDSSLASGYSLEWYETFYCGDSTDDFNANNTKAVSVNVITGPAKTTNNGVYEANSMISLDKDGRLPYIIKRDIPFISYEVLFSNTLSDTVFDFIIEIELPNDLDLTTLSNPFSSLPFELVIIDRTLYVSYKDIILADTGTSSLNHYGFLQFNIGISSSVKDGDIIDIYADIHYNNIDVITTNTVSHKIEVSTKIDKEEPSSAIDFTIQPNPNNGTFTIVFSKDNSENRCDLTIFDLVGTEVYQALDLQTNVINVNDLAQGVYLVKLNVGGIISTRKMVVE